MSKILDRDEQMVIVKFSIREYEEYINGCDHNLYELDETEISQELNQKLDNSLKIPKNLLVNI